MKWIPLNGPLDGSRPGQYTGLNKEGGNDDLQSFAAGRLLGLALLHGQALGIQLAPCLLRAMTGEPLRAADAAAVDPLYFKNRIAALLAPGGLAAACEALCCDQLFFAADEAEPRVGVALAEVELKPGGKELPVGVRRSRTAYIYIYI